MLCFLVTLAARVTFSLYSFSSAVFTTVLGPLIPDPTPNSVAGVLGQLTEGIT